MPVVTRLIFRLLILGGFISFCFLHRVVDFEKKM